MKRRYSVLVLLMAFIYLFSLTASASVKDILAGELQEELDYMEDVYKYDLSLTEDEGESVEDQEAVIETLQYEKAMHIAAALNLIPKLSDGTFSETQILSVESFCKIAEGLLGDGSAWVTETAITHKTALIMLMQAVGYEFLTDEAQIVKWAQQNDLLKGFSYNPEKHISRGEMSQMLYNALSADKMELVTLGSMPEYASVDGESLLYKRFHLLEIEGLVTAANGLDIYANRTVPKDTVAIDRISYQAGEADVSGLLGQRVYALVSADDTDANTVIFIGVSPENKSVLISFENVISLQRELIYDVGNGEESVSVSDIEYVTVNGVTSQGSAALEAVTQGEGTLLLAASERRGGYNIAVINTYESFLTDRISTLDEKLYFADGLTLNGNGFVSLAESTKNSLNIFKNGKAATVADLAAGDAVSIFTYGSSFVQIEASDRTVTGTVESAYEDKVTIDGAEYVVSDAYTKARLNGAQLPLLTPGTGGSFLLNALGHIVYTSANESGYAYAILKDMKSTAGGLEESMTLRIFTIDAEWYNYDFAKQSTVDGVEKMDPGDVIDYLTPLREELKGTLIRYKLNGDDEITGLDTEKDRLAEAGDVDRVMRSAIWDGLGGQYKLDWRKGLNLRGSSYSLVEKAPIFYIPDEPNSEEEYMVANQNDLVANSAANLILYNADEFFRAKLAVNKGSVEGGSFVNTEHFLVTRVLEAVDKNDNEVLVVEGLLSSLSAESRGWIPQKYTTTAQLAKNNDIKPGDLMHRNLDSNGRMYQIRTIMRAEERDTTAEFYEKLGEDDKCYGTVVSVDPNSGMMRVRCGTEELSYEIRIVGIYDSSTGKGMNVSLGDVMPGDKVFLRGGYRLMNAMVYR